MATRSHCSHEDVDATRIGVVGISLGGQHALWLGALDERISAVVSMAYFTERFAWLFQRPNGDPTLPPSSEFVRQIRPYDTVLYHPSMGIGLDDVNVAALIQPRLLILVSGTQDPRYAAAKREFRKVQQLYQHVGSEGEAIFVEFQGGHEVSLEQVIPLLQHWRME